MLWEPSLEDRDEAFLQVEYGNLLGDLPVIDVLDEVYCFERLTWFGQVLANMERVAPSMRVLLNRSAHGRVEFPEVPTEIWIRAAGEADKQEQVSTRFIHYGSPLEVVLGVSVAAGAAVGTMTLGFQRVLMVWANLQEVRLTHVQHRMLRGYYRNIEEEGADAFETPEDYHRFMANVRDAERGLQGVTELTASNLPPLGATR